MTTVGSDVDRDNRTVKIVNKVAVLAASFEEFNSKVLDDRINDLIERRG